MNLKIVTLLVLAFLNAQAEVYSQHEILNKCLLGYKDSKTVFFNVSYFNLSGQGGVAFRNGKNFKNEELNVFYKGKFWKLPLTVAPGFYDQRSLAIRVGGEKLCLKHKFNFVATDTVELTKYSSKTCGDREIVTLAEADEQSETSPAKVAAKLLANDLAIYYNCIRSRNASCGEENIRSSGEKISKWNSEVCNLSDQKALSNLVTEQHVLLKSINIPLKSNSNVYTASPESRKDLNRRIREAGIHNSVNN